MAGFLGLFLVLFVASGVGNGSTVRMVPVVFRAHHLAQGQGEGEAAHHQALLTSWRETAAVLGLTSASGPTAASWCPRPSGCQRGPGDVGAALMAFVAFYAS